MSFFKKRERERQNDLKSKVVQHRAKFLANYLSLKSIKYKMK